MSDRALAAHITIWTFFVAWVVVSVPVVGLIVVLLGGQYLWRNWLSHIRFRSEFRGHPGMGPVDGYGPSRRAAAHRKATQTRTPARDWASFYGDDD